MSLAEAEKFLADYKNLLKRWTMVGAGIEDGDAEQLHRRLKANVATLREIGVLFPDKAYTVEMLCNALTTNFTSKTARSLRPEGRGN